MKKGSSRYVFFVFGFAIKLPSFYSYRNFLWGLIANLNERKMYHCLKSEKLCPIYISSPLGFFNIMPKVELLNEDEFNSFNPIDFCCLGNDSIIPAESKRDSFGIYKGKIVVIDYG